MKCQRSVWEPFIRAIKGIRCVLYRIRARIEDWRIGGISLEQGMSSRFPEMGAHATESTNYIWLDRMFKAVPLEEDDVFLDIGCGEGRVLTYLYLRGFRGPMTGIELDEDNAKIAAQRTRTCKNIEILCKNVLECADTIGQATAVYLFNPFTEPVMEQFIGLMEKVCKQPVVVYYCCDKYRQLLDKRKGWTILWRNLLHSPGRPARPYTIYGYMPPEKEEKLN